MRFLIGIVTLSVVLNQSSCFSIVNKNKAESIVKYEKVDQTREASLQGNESQSGIKNKLIDESPSPRVETYRIDEDFHDMIQNNLEEGDDIDVSNLSKIAPLKNALYLDKGLTLNNDMEPSSKTVFNVSSVRFSEMTHSFIATLSVIVVSELGDKTFFIAAIMAMRHDRSTVFSGAILALIVMHVFSALFGYVWIAIIPKFYTHLLSTLLFLVFGVRMLFQAWTMSDEEGKEEMEEVQEDLKKRDAAKSFLSLPGRSDEDNYHQQINSTVEDELTEPLTTPSETKSDTNSFPTSVGGGDYNTGNPLKIRLRKSRLASGSKSACHKIIIRHLKRWLEGIIHVISKICSPIFLQAFTMTFVAEWGDRSQIATIVLAARENLSGVICGGILGHAACTGLAVIGGRIVATRISVKSVTWVGGVVFIAFALSTLLIGGDGEE